MESREHPYRPLRLKDGRTVSARGVQASDTGLFSGYFDGMSQRNREFMHGFRFDREMTERITGALDDETWYRIAVVDQSKSGERIVGYSWIQPLRNPEAKPFLGIGLVDEFTNVGLGRALLRLMLRDAGRVLGLDRVWLGVFADNPRAIRAYEIAGFTQDPDMPPRDFDGRTELCPGLFMDPLARDEATAGHVPAGP